MSREGGCLWMWDGSAARTHQSVGKGGTSSFHSIPRKACKMHQWGRKSGWNHTFDREKEKAGKQTSQGKNGKSTNEDG